MPANLSLQHQNTAVQLQLPLLESALAAPASVRNRGYRAGHQWPLVCGGKGADGAMDDWHRVAPHEAWSRWPSLEVQPPHMVSVLAVDMDRPSAHTDLAALLDDGEICMPSWMVKTEDNGHIHALWCLRNPVYTGDGCKPKPLHLAGRVTEYLAVTTGSDPSYGGKITHNPMRRAQRHGRRPYLTVWGPTGGYTLHQLARMVPKGWRLPKAP